MDKLIYMGIQLLLELGLSRDNMAENGGCQESISNLAHDGQIDIFSNPTEEKYGEQAYIVTVTHLWVHICHFISRRICLFTNTNMFLLIKEAGHSGNFSVVFPKHDDAGNQILF